MHKPILHTLWEDSRRLCGTLRENCTLKMFSGCLAIARAALLGLDDFLQAGTLRGPGSSHC